MDYMPAAASSDYPAHRHYQHHSLPRNPSSASTNLRTATSDVSLVGQYTFPQHYNVNSPVRTHRAQHSRSSTSPDVQPRDLYRQRHSIPSTQSGYPRHRQGRNREASKTYGHSAIGYNSLGRDHKPMHSRLHHPGYIPGHEGSQYVGGSQESRRSEHNALIPSDSIPWEYYSSPQSDPSLPYEGSVSSSSSRRNDFLQSLEDSSDHSLSDSTQTSDQSDHSHRRSR